jgi:hypothetical protein
VQRSKVHGPRRASRLGVSLDCTVPHGTDASPPNYHDCRRKMLPRWRSACAATLLRRHANGLSSNCTCTRAAALLPRQSCSGSRQQHAMPRQPIPRHDGAWPINATGITASLAGRCCWQTWVVQLGFSCGSADCHVLSCTAGLTALSQSITVLPPSFRMRD